MASQKIRGRGPLGWIIAVLLMGNALALLMHVPDTGPHQFTTTEDTSAMSNAVTPTITESTSTTVETPTTTSTTSAPAATTSTIASVTTSTGPPTPDNVLVGNTLLVRSASQDGADFPIQTRLTIRFRQDAGGQSASWTGGCNTISAPVVIRENTIDVGQITSTAVGCASQVANEEGFVTALMRSNPRWDLVGNAVVVEGGGRRIVADAYAS